MWEQLNVPIVPLVFYGAYELYPASSWVNNTGKVCGCIPLGESTSILVW
jgi:hypothetical protein